MGGGKHVCYKAEILCCRRKLLPVRSDWELFLLQHENGARATRLDATFVDVGTLVCDLSMHAGGDAGCDAGGDGGGARGGEHGKEEEEQQKEDEREEEE